VSAELVFATSNLGKLAELTDLLGGAVRVRSAADFPQVVPPEEDGATFEENARKKALHYARATSLPALADDSGLCVDALGGRPGVHSARYAPGTDADRYRALLLELDAVPVDRRGAAFRCALCLAFPDGRTVVEEGDCPGRIARAPCGEGGFGYDPVFVVSELGRTMAELTRAEKSRVSHRGRAFARMRPHLLALGR